MSFPKKFIKLSFLFSVAASLAGLLVIIGWVADILFLKSISPHWGSMKFNAAVCFFLAGIILLLVNSKKEKIIEKKIAPVLAGIIFIIAAITLLEYIFNFNAGIDELFFKDKTNVLGGLPPGRFSPTSAVYFLIFGFFYLPGTNKWIKTPLFQGLNILSGIIILASFLSYMLGTYIIAGVSLEFIFIVFSTFSFLMLILAVFFSQPDVGIMKLVSSHTNGGKMIRTTLPFFIFIFIFIGWLFLKGQQAGFYNREFGTSVFILVMIIVTSFLIVTGAASFIKSEKVLKQSEEWLNRAEKMGNMGHGYFDIEKNSMNFSQGLYEIFGVVPQNFSHTIEGLKSVIHPGDNLIMDQAFDKMMTDGNVDVEFRIVRPDGEVRNVFFKTALTKNYKGEYVNSFTTALDITDRKKAEEQIKTYNVQLRLLAANLQSIREEERRRIGREIHDELGQWLTVLKIEIARLKKTKGDDNKVNESVTEMLILVDGCIQSSKKISTELRPTLIDDLGLIAALEWQAEEFEKRTHIKTVFKTSPAEPVLPPDFTIAIFRIFQESLTNVARHAEATSVTSTLFISNGSIVLNIIDNGKGFDTAIIGTTKTLGLIGMKERALLLNGTYIIRSIPGSGTEITVTIPLPMD